jgi:hypothetical protein
MKYEVGLFDVSSDSIRLVGRSAEPELVASVCEVIAAERRQELAQLTPAVRLVTSEPGDSEE